MKRYKSSGKTHCDHIAKAAWLVEAAKVEIRLALEKLDAVPVADQPAGLEPGEWSVSTAVH